MRILDKQAVVMDLGELGMAEAELARFRAATPCRMAPCW